MPLNSPILTGDVSGGLHSTSVDKLKAQPLAGTAPTAGQTLTWTGSAWAPSTPSSGGGGGANGLTYYLNQSTDADAPVTGIPGTPKQLGRTGQATQVDVTTGELTPDTWTLVAGFVSEVTPQDPATTLIPAGLWDFNVWALGVADQNHSNSIRTRAYIYNGTTLTPLATSAVQAITATSAQYALSMLVEQTTLLATDRIYVAIEALATANGHTVTAQFGDNTPSHVHTSLGLVGGTGLWKNTAGVLQSPASLLVDADVDPAAAIAQSKIAGLTSALGAKAAQAQVDIYATAGTFTWAKPAGARLINVAVISGGGGGASGRKAGVSTVAWSGGGGGGGSLSIRDISASLLAENETVVVGSGGSGGSSQTQNNSNGLAGTNGGNSSFGTLVQVQGGGGAQSPTPTGGQAGASASARAMFQGGNGGSGNNGTGTAFGGVNSAPIAGGGGGGGGLIISPTVGIAGATGGVALATWISGGQASGGAIGSNGASAVNSPANLILGGSAGGGGGSSITGNAGSGGSGALYGGGGGGGGAALDNVGNSGAGGNGAGGIVIVTTYF